MEAAKEKSEEENSTYIKAELALRLSGEGVMDDINTGPPGAEFSLGTNEAWVTSVRIKLLCGLKCVRILNPCFWGIIYRI